MTPALIVALAVAALILIAGLALDVARSFGAARAYTDAGKALQAGPGVSPRVEGSPLESGWRRYRRALASGPESGPRLIRPESIFSWTALGIGPSGVRSSIFALLWALWGMLSGTWIYVADGDAAGALLFVGSGASAAIVWMVLHLIARRMTELAASGFYSALRSQDGLVEPGHFELEIERRAGEERVRVREAERGHQRLLLEQREALTRMGPELAEGLYPAIRESLESSLIPVLASMTSTLQRLSSEVEQTQKVALETMAASFKEQMMAGFANEFDALAAALHEAAAWHEKVHRDLSQLLIASQNLSEGHIAMLRRTRHVSEAVRSNAESLSRAERSLELAADRVQGAATTITGLLEGTSSSVADTLRNASEELATQLGELTATLNDQMEQSGEQLTRRIQSISLMLQRLASDIDTLGREQRPRPGGAFRGF